MPQTLRSNRWLALAGFALYLCPGLARAGLIWNESVDGDLSDSQAAPNVLILESGVSSLVGTVGGGSDPTDWVAMTVPVGFTLDSIELASYASADARAFIGFQEGVSFVGSPFVPNSYAGYAHFGPGGPGVVGIDLIPIFADNSPGGSSDGAVGFAQPLGAGTYTFLIQQLGAPTNYQFDYQVSPIPEPAALVMAPLICGWLFVRRIRCKRVSPAELR